MLQLAVKRCPKCGEDKTLDQWTTRKSGPRVGEPVAWCKTCNVDSLKARKERDPTIYRRVEWPSKLKRFYGITVDDYYRMLEEQNGGCAICHAKTPGMRHYKRSGRIEMFHVDHCHSTGRVRGLLCSPCNRAIGFLRDSPDLALRVADYLK